ncbi:hypothetical protein L2K70_18565 [Nocardioides KLBMP 9356]|uniref:Uncharacterized protein n=1 Tax=Nocardioides potassii TaxID=2911371 RepID=A0ABS9HGN6_9ACTN|nr:hypothetical protein [Nocardioides potassii]MCF6379619.1 hypothetical protein [Nocardioides potassii]
MARRRTTQQSVIARSFGGRSGFVSDELDGLDRPGEQMGRWERTAAFLNWQDSHNHYEEYADENRTWFGRLLPSYELVVAIAVALVFVGGYTAFIVFLALTR